ncbi:hypothetical protein TCAP_03244 [Tolypocladium capitatum]|uniref:Uncharacterized protein n=1 Tax=Tolypocladium capitatum TaxID=45235 RepID=A0A2K3QH10_9HYPO|nr:hypothetical protein TCAP_03244 [Tolypocladium capitatum]
MTTSPVMPSRCTSTIRIMTQRRRKRVRQRAP